VFIYPFKPLLLEMETVVQLPTTDKSQTVSRLLVWTYFMYVFGRNFLVGHQGTAAFKVDNASGVFGLGKYF
jgi:hypothetical protein